MKSKLLITLIVMLCSYLPVHADKKKKPPTPKPQTEACELCKLLTKYGNNPEGIPPLQYAILKNDTKAVDLLLKYGADPLTVNINHESCLYYAIKSGNITLIKKFISLGNSVIDLRNKKDFHLFDALHVSIICSQFEATKLFINTVTVHPKVMKNYCFNVLSPKVCNFTIDQKKELILLMLPLASPINHKHFDGQTLLGKLLAEFPQERELADFLRCIGAE